MNEQTYEKPHCWQYQIRLDNFENDVRDSNLSLEEIEHMKIDDFQFKHEDKKDVYDEAKKFIERHEWLGTISIYPTHIFTARYKGILAGIVVMDMPNAFSKALGDETKNLERLISRGACISWSPKNLASKLVSFSMNWMVKNTQYRYFTAYSDSEAKELGTIYQACNFYYLGQKFGAKKKYKIREDKWVSDLYFRSRSVYKKLAKENGIVWEDDWSKRDRVYFDLMPSQIAAEIKRLSKDYMLSCESRELPLKRKYAYVLGEDKRETKELRKIFLERNKIYEYPKER
jgi:hypothetical protein